MNNLIKIQSELKAPKGQFNSFGKYKYRSCEDILEALKPLLLKHGCTLTINDEIKQIGNVIYCEATATITSGEETLSVKAQAGIDIEKKGMDISQCFGSSSSYARKYALNGLFLIDDTKDADTYEGSHTNAVSHTNSVQPKQVTAPNIVASSEPTEWLSENSDGWNRIMKSHSEGKSFSIADIRKKYKVSKAMADKLKEAGIS